MTLVECCSGKGGISAHGGPGALSNFKVTTFQGNSATAWLTDAASVWKANLANISITGICTRGIASVKIKQRVSGSSSPFVDSGVSVSCVNNA